jgi:hypothetical protein
MHQPDDRMKPQSTLCKHTLFALAVLGLSSAFGRVALAQEEIANHQIYVGFNGPESSSTSFFASAGQAESSWLGAALGAKAKNLLSQVDFSHQLLVASAVGARENTTGNVSVDRVFVIDGSVMTSLRIGVNGEGCKQPKVASYPFVLTVIEKPTAFNPDSGGQDLQNFDDGCKPVPSATDASAQAQTGTANSFVPIKTELTATPGYRNEIYVALPQNESLEFRIRNLHNNPTAKWKPTVWLSPYSQGAPRYFFNLSVDPALGKMYARVRSIDIALKKELRNTIRPTLYDLDHEFDVKLRFDGSKVQVTVDGELIDEQDIQGNPELLEIGASSGSFDISLVEAMPPPAQP